VMRLRSVISHLVLVLACMIVSGPFNKFGQPSAHCCAKCRAWVSRVKFTPTVQHCSLATLIGLCLRVKLMRALPPRFKVRQP